MPYGNPVVEHIFGIIIVIVSLLRTRKYSRHCCLGSRRDFFFVHFSSVFVVYRP